MQRMEERTRQHARRQVRIRRDLKTPPTSRPTPTRPGIVSHMRDRRTGRTWGDYARAARKAALLSVAELAKRTGIGRATLYRWEGGDQRPERAEMVARWAETVGVDLDEALTAAGLRPMHDVPERPTRQQPPADPDLAWLAARLQDPTTSEAERDLIRATVRHLARLARLADADDQRREAG